MVANSAGKEGLRQRNVAANGTTSDIVTISDEGKKTDERLDKHER